MKKFLKILFFIVLILLLAYIVNPYKIKTVCFGDVCPDNGGTYLFYKKAYSEEECKTRGDIPIIGFGWSKVYAGCSPDNSFSRFIEKKFNK